MSIVVQAIVVAASTLLLVLSIDVIGAMRPRGGWGAWALWVGIAFAALAAALSGLAGVRVPLPVAVLLLTLALLLWRQRRRLAWSARRGEPW